ncbi:hypothetical protein JY651_12525 [Pyxidicoccus parkwayensis]|uniref:Glycosyltransferase RgtA/B/C/D-like domain-containing protein n=1 Tax=Pyxidicoccus parkwayensis TaxID=2813578 RepID=A0ABX7P5H7_9BACT|nr:hypothetical protein [Pyxidicoccus parkwaysis]QSQ25698.1 hypothetical protein JY651_12525 [Pyxidicoccus parkwaysis]
METHTRWLSYPRVLWLALTAAVLVSWPMFRMVFLGDDYIYLGILANRPTPAPIDASTFNLYRFVTGDSSVTTVLMQKGIFPWWTLPELKMAFWRPLTSATMALDHALFGTTFIGYQVHSLLWYAGLIAAYSLLMRRVLPGAVGAVALLLFAMDDVHAIPVAWWCNRNALVATLPALLGLWLHLEWRERGRTWAAPLSSVLLLVGLTGGETALGVFAYVLAYELLGAKGPWRSRLLGVAPAAVLAVVYLAVYKQLGYGSFGSDAYLDPTGQPLAWLKAACVRIPAMIHGLLLSIPSDLSFMFGGQAPLFVVLGVGSLALVLGVLRALGPYLPEDERRHARWLLAGALLALLPVSSAIQSDRLLTVPGVGGSAVIGLVITHLWRNRSRSRGWRAMTGVAALLVLTHVLLAPLTWYFSVTMMEGIGRHMVQFQQQLEKELDPQQLPNQRVVVLTLPEPDLAIYASVNWWAQGLPLPRAWWTLSYASQLHRIHRTGPNTLEVELLEGRFFDSLWERVHRSGRFPLAQGAEVDLHGVKVKVLEVDALGARRLAYTFDVPLEDSSLVFMHWRDGALHRLRIPPVEGQATLGYASSEGG